MSTPHYGDTARDPQDAAKESREQRDCDRAPITAEQAADYFDGKPLATAKNDSSALLGLLQRFCSTDENRFFLRKPFNQDGFTWATGGRILVRVPQLAEVENDPEVRYPNAVSTWTAYDITRAAAAAILPEIPEDAGRILTCSKCNDGTSYCNHCDNWGECHHCHGQCTTLDPRWIKIGGQPFKLYYLAKVKNLENPQIIFRPPGQGYTFGFLYFKSGIIEGVLAGLTMEPGQDADNEWKPEPAAADSKEAA